jgi:PST family polysaccharide transporter
MSGYFDDHKIEQGHGQRSLRSGAVSIGGRAINAGIQVVSVLVLARLLSPEDYGLVSMVIAITGFAPNLVSLGTPDVVAQRARITEEEVSSLFWVNLAVGVAGALLIAASGPLIAWFYGEPRLTSIAMVSSLTFVMSALSCQHQALMRRSMQFPEIAKVEVSANVLSVIGAISMAFYGLQYWALVLRPVTMNALLAAGVWLHCKWLPRRPKLSTSVKEMLKQGMNLTGFTMTDFFARSSDRVAIGYRSGAATLGYYQNALFVYENALEILALPLHRVAISSLSKARDDAKELYRLWSKALSTLVFFGMPAFGILAVTSQDLIVLLIGSKWAHAGALLSILALRGIPHTVERTLGWLHMTAGRTDRYLRWGLIGTGAQLVALLCGLPFGATGIVIAYVICTFILFVPAIAYAGQPLGIGARDVIKVVWKPLAASLTAVAVGFALRYSVLADSSSIARMLLLILAYGGVYLGIVVGLLGMWTPITVVMTLVRDVLPARFAHLMRTPKFMEGQG